MLEVYEGMNVKALEDYQQVKDCLKDYRSVPREVAVQAIH